MQLKIATWNINSVRLRLESVVRFTEEFLPDVLCLQETKVADPQFPFEPLKALGYSRIEIKGQPGHHGVATLCRVPVAHVERHDWCAKGDARHVFVGLACGVGIHNFYVPSGGDVPDPEQNDKFAHKLDFLDEMADYFGAKAAHSSKLVLVGDLNVAPHENDVWSHRQLLKVVSHTPVEVDALDAVFRATDWVDAVRRYVPVEEKLFSWWSYRSRDWRTSDRGRRLDHIWVTSALEGRLLGAEVAKDVRGWDKPSDHAPVLATLEIDG